MLTEGPGKIEPELERQSTTATTPKKRLHPPNPQGRGDARVKPIPTNDDVDLLDSLPDLPALTFDKGEPVCIDIDHELATG